MKLRRPGARTACVLGIACLMVGATASPSAAGTNCKGISDPAQRLACYDALEAQEQLDPIPQTGASAETAELKAEIAAKDAKIAELKETQSGADDWSVFGMPATRSAKDPLNEAAAKADQGVERDEDGDIEAINSAIADFSVSADNMLTVVLANGQVWRQVSGRELHLKTQSGANAARISRTLMGGFAMTVNGKNDVAIMKRLDGKRKR